MIVISLGNFSFVKGQDTAGSSQAGIDVDDSSSELIASRQEDTMERVSDVSKKLEPWS